VPLLYLEPVEVIRRIELAAPGWCSSASTPFRPIASFSNKRCCRSRRARGPRHDDEAGFEDIQGFLFRLVAEVDDALSTPTAKTPVRADSRREILSHL